MARDCAAITRRVYQTGVFQRALIANIIPVRRGSHLPINSGSIRVLCEQVPFESVCWGDDRSWPLGLVVLSYLMRAMSSARHAVTASLTTLISACGTGESNVVTGNRDGVLHYGNGTEPQGLDPHVVTGVPENHIIRALFEGLAVKNPITLEPEPGVAERWEFSDEGRVITFFLNPEAKWSNGEQVTASDYVWAGTRLHPMTGNGIPTCSSRW